MIQTITDESTCQEGRKSHRKSYRTAKLLSYVGAVVESFGRGDETHLAVTLTGHEDHTFGLYAENLTRLEVCKNTDLLAYHILWKIELGDS